ncbi:MAG: alpha/beta hydrolase [Candidatus Nitrosocosmicus sp.]|nr:alpha/beta hydrolase [Candidatus Nitrosocosmicus sp.]
MSTLIVSSSTISNHGHNGVTNVVYGQIGSDLVNSTNATTTNLVNLPDIPLEKAQVGDIEIAYKMFGKGDPLILHNGASDGMDAWEPALLTRLASNNTVIVFDSRGIGNTTAGTEPYSIQLLANDTAGLMDALNIEQANILGFSLSTFITQQFAISYPEKVSSVILIAGSCGGKDTVPRPAWFNELQAGVVNKSLNNIPISQEEIKALVNASVGPGWIKLHPESLDLPANMTFQQMKPSLSPQTMNNQMNAGQDWIASDWNGACDDLAKIAKPMLVIAGTDDNLYVPHENSLVIASNVPGAWLVQIKDAGHAVPDQYPEEVGKIVQTFLSTIK